MKISSPKILNKTFQTFLTPKNLIKHFILLIKLFILPLGKLDVWAAFIIYWLFSIYSLIYSPFPNTVSEETFYNLPLTLQYMCDLQDVIPRHKSPITSHPILPREADDFSRAGKYSEDVSLSTFLAYMQPAKSIILDWCLYMSKSWMFYLWCRDWKIISLKQ